MSGECNGPLLSSVCCAPMSMRRSQFFGDQTLENTPYGTTTAFSPDEARLSETGAHAAVLLAGISGSARLHEKLGSAEAARAVDRCVKRMERAVEAFRGRILRNTGDEMLALFAQADGAAQAALEMIERVADLPPVSGIQLEIRIGFAHGKVVEETSGLGGDTVAQAAWLAGFAKPGQILTNGDTAGMLPENLQRNIHRLALSPPPERPISGGVIEVVLPNVQPAAPAASGASANPAVDTLGASRLKLHYHERVLFFHPGQQSFQMGRDEGSDLVIHDRRASRQHGALVWRGDKVVLIDKSTNGTYVTIDDEPELFLRRKECILRGKGMICFSAPIGSADADFVCYEFQDSHD